MPINYPLISINNFLFRFCCCFAPAITLNHYYPAGGFIVAHAKYFVYYLPMVSAVFLVIHLPLRISHILHTAHRVVASIYSIPLWAESWRMFLAIVFHRLNAVVRSRSRLKARPPQCAQRIHLRPLR